LNAKTAPTFSRARGLLSGYKSKAQGPFSLIGPLHSRPPTLDCFPCALQPSPRVAAVNRPRSFPGDNGEQEPTPPCRRLGHLLGNGEAVGRASLRWTSMAEDEPDSARVEGSVV
jgi:hypothetical protein